MSEQISSMSMNSPLIMKVKADFHMRTSLVGPVLALPWNMFLESDKKTTLTQCLQCQFIVQVYVKAKIGMSWEVK